MSWNPDVGVGVQVIDHLQTKAALQGYHLIDPENDCQVSVEGSLSVSITSGDARLGGRPEYVSPQTESLPNPDTDNPLKALVYLDSSGNLNTLGGDPAPAQPDGEIRDKTFNPSVPVPDEGFLPLAEVWVEEDVDSIVENDIISRRMPFSMGNGSGINADRWKGEDSLGYNDIDGSLGHHELSNVGSSDHHSRPSSTNTTGMDFGWVNVAPNEVPSDINIIWDNFPVLIDGVRIDSADNSHGSYTSYMTIDVSYTDGSETYETEGSSNGSSVPSETWNFDPRMVDDIPGGEFYRVENTDGVDFHMIGLLDHNHSI